jgi:hypothetical protein
MKAVCVEIPPRSANVSFGYCPDLPMGFD